MEKLTLKTKAAYGLAGVGDSALYTLIGTFLIFFLNAVVGINPAICGTIAAVGALWETIWGAIMGYISDNTNSRFGRRKPFLLVVAFPLAVVTSLLFTTVNLDGSLRVTYYMIMVILFWSGFVSFFVPYLAWGAELTQDYEERTVLRGYTYVFNSLGMALGMVLPTVIVDFLMNMDQTLSHGWQATGIFCGICSGITIFLGGWMIKDKHEVSKAVFKAKQIAKKKFNLKSVGNAFVDMGKNYWQILKLRSVRFIVATSIFYLIGYAIFCSSRIYFLTFNMKLGTGQITFVMSLMTFASILFVPLILSLNKKMDKRSLYICGMGIAVVSMITLGILGIYSMVTITIYSVLYSIGSICYWQLVPAMIYDVCEVDQLANNTQRAGLVISLQSLAESAANAVGLQILGIILQFAGFQAEAKAQAAHTLTWINLSFSVIPALFMLVSIIMVFKYPVTKQVYNNVLNALDRKKKGELVDLDEFSPLIKLKK
ncbi:MAG: MFS transporter [Anaerovoracaceae bacterium]